MAGTKAGSKKSVATIKQKYGDDWYKKIGRKGGSVTGPNKQKKTKILTKLSGADGGRLSRNHGRKTD